MNTAVATPPPSAVQPPAPPPPARVGGAGLQHISPTAAKNYLSCPLRYWFERVLRPPRPTITGMEYLRGLAARDSVDEVVGQTAKPVTSLNRPAPENKWLNNPVLSLL